MQRLVQAVLDIWECEGASGASARAISRLAQTPVSGIYHHFGSLEQLFLSAHEQAQRDSERWCAARLAELDGVLPLSRDAFPTLLAALIDQWCETERRLAFAWRECQLIAARELHYAPVCDRWAAMWRAFWEEVCTRCGHPGRGAHTAYLFDGEASLHLMRWRRPVDRAGLEEMCAGWNDWLCGRPVRDSDWRRFAREQADLALPEPTITSGTMEQIADAAADVLALDGMAALTHRAVAARAGLTLGVVSYNFRSSAELVRAAFEMIYRKVVASGGWTPPPEAAIMTDEELFARYSNPPPRNDRILPALDELMLAAARDADLRDFAPQLRYRRGRTSGGLLRAILGRDISPLEAALFSGFVSGHRKTCFSMTAGEAAQAGARAMLDLRTMLGTTAASTQAKSA
ncbi:TetR family transcriptional regulator [Sphingobium sp. AP49]|uniref:TetR/AcrR family transcriptional regulator n=1 Tax=Sphingobium sp. AP49 TaxID=1144307 RepID=UPI0002FF71FD|nr:TetR/AcrR family transcriptional regulator [Sphingobium sp. AP49]WHO39858.1 TetR family transcriptional regulator [Sphingobium sp. AP49]